MTLFDLRGKKMYVGNQEIANAYLGEEMFFGEPKGIPSYYQLATNSEFSGTSNGEFKYIGTKQYVIIPPVIKGVTITSLAEMFLDGPTQVKGVASENPNITSIYQMFRAFKGTNHLELKWLDTSNVTSMTGAFYYAMYVPSIDVSTWQTSKVISMNDTFRNMENIQELDLLSFDFSLVTYSSATFSNNPKLKTIYVRNQAAKTLVQNALVNNTGVSTTGVSVIIRPYILGPNITPPGITPGKWIIPGAYDFKVGTLGDLKTDLIYKGNLSVYDKQDRFISLSDIPSASISVRDGKEYFRTHQAMGYWMPNNRGVKEGMGRKRSPLINYNLYGQLNIGDLIKYTAYSPLGNSGQLFVHEDGVNAISSQMGPINQFTPEPKVYYHEVTSLPGESGLGRYLSYDLTNYPFEALVYFTDIEIIPMG